MNVVATVAVVAASLIVLAALELPACAWVIGRLKRARAESACTCCDDAIPPDEDADWLASWPADTPISVIEAAYYDKEFLAIPEVAADLRWSA